MMLPFVLITDSNNQDIYFSVLKYHILSIHPQFSIFEYYINSFENKVYRAAAYILLNEHYFPKNTIFYLEINIPQKIDDQKLLLIEYNQKWIFTPDNGLIGLLEQEKIQNVYYWIEPIQTSFYSKNEMLHSLKNFIENNLSISEKFIPFLDKKYIQFHWPQIIERTYSNNSIKKLIVPILYIDSFENVILHFKRTTYNNLLLNYDITINLPLEKIKTISNTYNSVDNNNSVAFFNDAGYLEIAFNGSKLASLIADKDIYSQSTYLINLELKPKQ